MCAKEPCCFVFVIVAVPAEFEGVKANNAMNCYIQLYTGAHKNPADLCIICH